MSRAYRLLSSVFIFSFIAFTIFSFWAHSSNSTPHRYIIQVAPEDISKVSKFLETQYSLTNKEYAFKSIFRSLDAYSLIVDSPSKSTEAIKSTLSQSKWIKSIELDREIKMRETIPSDTDYSLQWGLEKINAPLAWDIAKGGKTINGDQIVVAVLDEGFMDDHIDLANQVWINTNEIAGNGIDDDNNGYVDDVRGANVDKDNGVHPLDVHGTAVSGIVSADTDNGMGVAGVAWDAQLMLLSGTTKVSLAIKAYDYALEQRQLYDATNGAEGAFVVATNYSAGITFAFPEDFPMWCAVYEKLGEAGILSVCATANESIDIDVEGDLPALCPSPYLITVTNTVISDNLAFDAGIGLLNVDIGAPGDGSYALDVGNSYREFSGTSAAAPHVAGSIALMYSAECQNLMDSYESNPGQTALAVKQAILNGSDKIDDLNGKSVSGGRLNVFKSLLELDSFCNSEVGELSIISNFPNPATDVITIEYQAPDFDIYNLQVIDNAGRIAWQESFTPNAFNQKIKLVNVKNWPEGVYHILLSNENHRTSSSFLVKK